MSEKSAAGLSFEVRNSMKIIRRDGTVEEIPGEWETITEEEARSRFGRLSDFREWLATRVKEK